MILKKIILENIKSYTFEKIDLSTGINCILGLNGTGKSTIIESIGFALFNYTKGSINQLLRYNEKKGIIKVEFIANDDRAYIVERTIRTNGGSVRIKDLDTNTELYSGVSDVYSFIKKILKIRKTKEFSKMFAEIIAVPQGSYVSAFLEKPSIRKENFDRLFDLHIYKDLGFKIKSIYDNIKLNYVDKLEKEIVHIDGQVINYNEKELKTKLLEEEINELIIKTKDLKDSLNDIIKDKVHLEMIKSKINENNNNLNLLVEKINYNKERMKKNQEELKKSQDANDIIEKTKADYKTYKDNQQAISKFEIQYNSFLEIQKKIQDLKTKIEIYNNDIKYINETIKEKTNDVSNNEKKGVK